MLLGADDAGRSAPIYADGAMQHAVDLMDLDFISFHLSNGDPSSTDPSDPSLQELRDLDRWGKKTGHRYLLNQEGSRQHAGDPGTYISPGRFFQPSGQYIREAAASPRCLGLVYDEAEHWCMNGGWLSIGTNAPEPAPHFCDARGMSIEDAYSGNMHNLVALMDAHYPGFADNARISGRFPIVGTENVHPVMQHLFARAGMVQMPKLLKETMTPVTAAMVMGAAKQYGVRHWTSIDLWGLAGYPSHSPDELESALHFSYWTGAEASYVESICYRGSLYEPSGQMARLSPYGEVMSRFKRGYMPTHPRDVCFEEFAPEVIIVRFEDTDWGQVDRFDWLRGYLYGSPQLPRDGQTSYWLKIWHLISHGVIPPTALNWSGEVDIPYRFHIPANNVAVYDHLASDPELYRSARLVFLTGKHVSEQCLSTLRHACSGGLTVIAPPHLCPPDMRPQPGQAAVHPSGSGRWVVTDDVLSSEIRELAQPYLGDPDKLRCVFGDQEVVFRAPDDPDRVHVYLNGTCVQYPRQSE